MVLIISRYLLHLLLIGIILLETVLTRVASRPQRSDAVSGKVQDKFTAR